MLSKINFEDVGGFALLGGLFQLGARGVIETGFSDGVKQNVTVGCRTMGILLLECALYYSFSPRLQKLHTVVHMTGFILSAGVVVFDVGGEIKGLDRTRKSVMGSHIAAEMISLGAFVATVVGVVFSDKHREVCVLAAAVQLPYWGLKFYKEVPHLGEKTVVTSKPDFVREISREEDSYIGRKELIESVRDCLYAGENVILKGKPGVGKTHLASHLKEGALSGEYTELKGVKIFQTNAKELIAGAGIVGTKEQRVKELFGFLNQFERVILFVDEIWQLVGTGIGMHGSTDLAGDFLTEIEGKNISVIGATTLDKEHYLIKNEAFNNRFEWIKVEELTPEQRKQVLKNEVKRLAVSIPDAYIENIPEKISLREAKRKIRLIAARMKRSGLTFEQAKQALTATSHPNRR